MLIVYNLKNFKNKNKNIFLLSKIQAVLLQIFKFKGYIYFNRFHSVKKFHLFHSIKFYLNKEIITISLQIKEATEFEEPKSNLFQI